jgi:hypothetical protein
MHRQLSQAATCDRLVSPLRSTRLNADTDSVATNRARPDNRDAARPQTHAGRTDARWQ